MTATLQWLAGRRPAAPATLAAHTTAACAGPDGELPASLARAGVALVRRVAGAGPGSRALALDLLAADALVTYAFEAQAEQDVDGVLALAERLAAGGDLA